jgi:hypothetical protein
MALDRSRLYVLAWVYKLEQIGADREFCGGEMDAPFVVVWMAMSHAGFGDSSQRIVQLKGHADAAFETDVSKDLPSHRVAFV